MESNTWVEIFELKKLEITIKEEDNKETIISMVIKEVEIIDNQKEMQILKHQHFSLEV